MQKVAKRRILLSFLAGAMLLTAACGSDTRQASNAGKDEITISAGVNLVAGKFDPTGGYGVWAPDIFHCHILKVGKDNKLVNDLAVAEKISADGLVYEYQLNKNAKFADGKPLTAKDVVFTFTTAMNKASAADLTMVAKVEAKDEHTVAFTLKKPWSTFPFTLSEVGIVAEHGYKQGYGDNPLCSGPWKIVEFHKDQQLILAPNEYYYGKKPNFKKVTILKLDEDAALAAAKSGKLDLVLVDSEFAKTDVKDMQIKKLRAIDAFAVNLPVIGPGTDEKGKPAGNAVTSDPAIRKALNIGIDRKKIIENALSGYGEPAYAAIDALPWSNGHKFEDNKVAEAKKILADAGWRDTNGNGIVDKNGVEAEFTVTGRSNDQARYNTVVALAENAKELGIKIVPKSAPWSECRVARATPTCWVFGQPNPIEFYRYYDSSQISKNIIGNNASYTNAEVDAVIAQALNAKDREEANKLWKKGQDIAQQDVPYLWLCYPDLTYFVKTGLQIPDLQKIPTRGQGISIVENMNEWSWK